MLLSSSFATGTGVFLALLFAAACISAALEQQIENPSVETAKPFLLENDLTKSLRLVGEGNSAPVGKRLAASSEIRCSMAVSSGEKSESPLLSKSTLVGRLVRGALSLFMVVVNKGVVVIIVTRHDCV